MDYLKDKKQWITILYVLFILFNIVLSPSLIVINAYALIIGLIIVFSIKWEKPSELLYYFVLLFSVLDFSFNLPVMGRFNIYYLHIALLILTITMLIARFKQQPLPRLTDVTKNKYSLFLFIFIVYMILSVAWAENRGMALKYMINYAIMICFMFAVYTYNPNRAKVKETLKVLLYTAIPVLAIGSFEMMGIRMPLRNIYTDHNLYHLAAYLRTIPTVFFYNPNNYGVYLVMAMSFILPFIAYNRTKGRNGLFWVMQLAAVVNLIFCTSRTAYIVMLLTLIGFVVFFAATKEWHKFRRVAAIGIVTLIVFYGLSNVPRMSVYFGKFNDTPFLNVLSFNKVDVGQPIADFEAEGSTGERKSVILDIVDGVFKKGHLQGFGVNNTAMYLKTAGNTNGIVNPHSLWFEVLGDFGVGIFLYFIFIYLSLLWDLRKVYLESIKDGEYGLTSYLTVSLIAALGGFILTAFAPSSVISFTQMWLLYGLAASLILRRSEFLKNPSKVPLD
ncbi:MAG: O-antigen ligase family protein [Desulfosporosinus sp.]|nr:O-antigen ligase family protein [Desulfosporosinus sp.]